MTLLHSTNVFNAGFTVANIEVDVQSPDLHIFINPYK
jgi:hypothetical protein